MIESDELRQMLVQELLSSKLNKLDFKLQYYNQYLGDTSILLTSLLEEHLLEDSNWTFDKWIDDCLITKLEKQENEWRVWGIVIWGRENTSQEWVDPFYFHLKIENITFKCEEYCFLFGESHENEITYEMFNENRNQFDVSFYSNDDWDRSERDWKYIITWKQPN